MAAALELKEFVKFSSWETRDVADPVNGDQGSEGYRNEAGTAL